MDTKKEDLFSIIDKESKANRVAKQDPSYKDQILSKVDTLMNNSPKEKQVKVNVCIDYFKCQFMWDFTEEDMDFKTIDLMNLLKVDVSDRDVLKGRDNFDNCYLLATETYLLFNPNDFGSKSDCGKHYFMIEMTGQGCRSFEGRGGNWLELLKFVNSHSHHFTRIDFAGDDINNFIPIKELKDKIRKEEFVSNFRKRKAFKLGNEEVTLGEDDGIGFENDPLVHPLEKDYGKGYSVTFGKKDNLQLQIYDKNEERKVKGFYPITKTWVRYEMRFGSNRADVIGLYMEIAMSYSCMGTLFASLLLWLIEFKERKVDENHMYREEIWSKYAEMLGEVSSMKCPVRQKDLETSIARCRSWVSNQWGSTLITLVGIDPMYLNGCLANSIKEYYKKHGISKKIYSAIEDFYNEHPEYGKYDKDRVKKNVEEFILMNSPYTDDKFSNEDDDSFDVKKY